MVPTVSSTASSLNASWDKLTLAFDKYFNGIPEDIRKVINKAITDWQDFYYGNQDVWPEEGLAKWLDVYKKTSQAMVAAIVQNQAKPEAIPYHAPTVAKELEPLLVTAKVPDWTFASVNWNFPTWGYVALGAVPAIALFLWLKSSRP